MSTTYVPRRKKTVAKTAWSYEDGGFDANVDGGQWIGRVHEYLQLPIAERLDRRDPPRVPWVATAAQTRAWAERLTTALKVFRIERYLEPGQADFLVGWRDFLATCGGYKVRP